MGSTTSWYNSFLNNTVIPLSNQRLNLAKSIGYALSVARIDFKELPHESAFDISIFFFDPVTKSFFGNQYISEVKRGSGTDYLHFHETVFFSGSQQPDKVVIVIELVKRERKAWVCGFTVIPLISKSYALTDFSATSSRDFPWRRYQFFKGSCKILMNCDGPLEDNKSLVKLNTFINCVVQTHQKLNDYLQYLPDYYLVAPKQKVPGFVSPQDGFQLANPEPQELRTAILDNVEILYTTAHIEGNILELLNKERCFCMNKSPSDASVKPLSVIDRRIRVGIHNSITFVEEPLKFDLSSGSGPLTARQSKGSRNFHVGVYSVNNTIKLSKLFEDDKCALIFMLEYQIGVRRASNISTDTQWVLVCWNAWCPFNNGTFKETDTITLPMVGGPRPNPLDVLCFKHLSKIRMKDENVLGGENSQIRIRFNYAMIDETSHLSPISSRVTTPKLLARRRKEENIVLSSDSEEELSQIPKKSTVLAPEKSPKQQRKLISEAARPAAYEEEDRAISPEFDSILKPESIVKRKEILLEADEFADHPVYLPGSPRTSSISRAVRSYLSKAKFPQILDRHGKALRVVDMGSLPDVNMNLEYNTRLDTHEIVLQFLAIMPISNNIYNFSNSGFKYFFTFQFYRFNQISTEVLSAHPAQEFKKGDPLLLRRVDENGAVIGNTDGLMIRFVVDRQSAFNQRDFANFLLKSSLFIDVWDAESLMHLGLCTVPLKGLLRHGNDGIQTDVQCNVMESGVPLTQATVTSILYLRMGNVGHPALNQFDILNSHNKLVVSSFRLPRLSISTKEQKAKVKPLESIHETALQRLFTAQKIDIKQREQDIFGDQNLFLLENWEQLKQKTELKSNVKLRKFLFKEELEAYKKMRSENKALKLLKTIFESITQRKSISIRKGEVQFFEFSLKNTFAQPINCVIDVNSKRLQVVTQKDEMIYVTNKLGIRLEKDLANRNEKGEFSLYLKAMETVTLPFKVDCFELNEMENAHSFEVKAIFKNAENGEPISILELTCHKFNTIVSQTFRWFLEENQKFSKVIRLPTPVRIQSLRCTDPNVLCLLRNNPTSGQEVLLSGFSSESPFCLEFQIYLFRDVFHSDLALTLCVTVHSLKRFNVQAIQGQASRIPLCLGDQVELSNSMLRLFSSSKALEIKPSDSIFIDEMTSKALRAIIRPNFRDRRAVIVTAVDSNLRKLITGWIFYIYVTKPNIVKTFRVEIPLILDQEILKKVPIDNQYPTTKSFRVHTSNEKILYIPDDFIEIEAHSSKNINVLFKPATSGRPFTVNELLFIENAQNGCQEEAYALEILYQ
uniref:Telo_bind domain-containing protein n=1 Tax=Bursaphelenchus xylophilus TaxID=6326 RepID=A0A1I7RNP3_BURXY